MARTHFACGVARYINVLSPSVVAAKMSSEGRAYERGMFSAAKAPYPVAG
jgi:hypothetical protein